MVNKKELAIKQIKLQEKMQASGVNMVTCGQCGEVLLHDTKDETTDCFCGQTMDLSDCPDYWFSGVENNYEFNN